MAKDIFKTRFSFHGFLAALLFLLPYLFVWFPARRIFLEFSAGPEWLLLLYVVVALTLFLTLILVRNEAVAPFSRKSRLMCIAYILLGKYYILWIYSFISKANPMVFIFARIAGSGFFIFFSLDRKNWLAFSCSIFLLVLGLTVFILALLV